MTVVDRKSTLPVPLRASGDTALSTPPPTQPTSTSTSRTAQITTMSSFHQGMEPPAQHWAAVTGAAAPTSTTHRPAGRHALDLRDPIAAHRAQLKTDLRTALDTLSTMPPALTFFGGARIQKDDPYYAISQEIGRLLAERGVPPRTGAGPGIMQSVPEGYVKRRDELHAHGVRTAPSAQLRDIAGVSRKADLDDPRTQGFNIKLPHEQKLNPVIEVAQEIQLFPFRKLALYENARGVVTFPGGFGTIDELFEIWNLSAAGRLSDPLAAVGVAFWRPILDALHRVAVHDRRLIDPETFARLFVTDDPLALLEHMLDGQQAAGDTPRAFEQSVSRLKKVLAKEVDVAAQAMRELKPAVAFLGGESLSTSDPALVVARELSASLAQRGVPVRVGDGGSGAQAVVDAARQAGADHAHVQSIVWEHSRTADLHGVAPAATFSERIPHKEALLRAAEAYVVLPAGLQGLDEMATVLCQMQTGKLPKRPLVLVGGDYWRPILQAFAQTMITPERKLIAPEDLELFTVVDALEDAERALTNLRAS